MSTSKLEITALETEKRASITNNGLFVSDVTKGTLEHR
jgi:hypothetical protein